ncbi:hypothetical protein ABMA28_006572 [Loxostege sticticalis]|uniref:Acyltransferase 3 domain-containing protein n=1 Tax=Loxostege sticticalis TaxID=481309 RepID=A0ABD0SLV5_LOXSC
MYQLVIYLTFLRSCSAVIYSLNETEYNKMPPLYALDEYSSCLLEPGGTYCVADFDLFAEHHSALMDMIQQYSAHKMKHFNHTQIHRGVCVTKTCERFIKDQTNDTADPRQTLEACLNHSIWETYKIQARLNGIRYCKRASDTIDIDTYDVIVAVVYVILIALNVIGSCYDVVFCKKRKKPGNPYLLAFSVSRNWNRLVAPTGTGDPRLERLKLFHGMRTMTMFCVFFSHTVLIMAFAYVNNPLFIEKSYEDPAKQILFNGSLVTHTFFVMSSFLMAFNLQLHAEKHKVGLMQWPKGVLQRWLRLTPTYTLVLATISTWMRHLGSGPLWDLVVGSEATACRQYWWAHLLYVNNYVYEDAWCAPQTWYLAADTQLFCFGLLLCVAARSKRARCSALLLTFLASLVILALHTYLQDLEAVVIQSPETYRDLYAQDNTFRLLYIRGHTNLSTYTLGLAGGFFAYYWQSIGKDFTKYKNFRWLFWLCFPLGVLVILSGGLFYTDGARAPTTLRVLYATFYKPVFQALVVMIILGCIFKIDSVYRSVVEWRGFTWAGRVSYSAFLLHTMFQRGLVGSQAQPTHMSDYYVMTVLCATIFLSFSCAVPLWLCVEAPAAAITRAAFASSRDRRDILPEDKDRNDALTDARGEKRDALTASGEWRDIRN